MTYYNSLIAISLTCFTDIQSFRYNAIDLLDTIQTHIQCIPVLLTLTYKTLTAIYFKWQKNVKYYMIDYANK